MPTVRVPSFRRAFTVIVPLLLAAVIFFERARGDAGAAI